jgi:uncharacterized membrane protein
MTISIDLKTKLNLWRKKIQLFSRIKFAHHPLCARFSDHVFKIKNTYLCQGCTLSYLGVLFGIFSCLLINPALTSIHWFFLGIGFLSPTLVIEILKIKYRPAKRSVRLIAGIGLGVFLGLIIIGSVPEKIFAALFSSISYFVFYYIRKLKKPKDKCEGCSELKEGGICSGLKLEFDLNRKYSDIASNILQDKISLKYINVNINNLSENVKKN